MDRIRALSTVEYQNDALIVAGDVSDQLSLIRQSLLLFVDRWKEVFFTWGNHELWVRGQDQQTTNSLGKKPRGLLLPASCMQDS